MQRNGRWLSAAAASAAMVGGVAVAAAAPVYDDLTTAANCVGWSAPAAYAPSTAVANGDGTTTFTRHAFWDAQNQVYPDAGIDWLTSRIDLTQYLLEVEPVARDNGFYNISIVYFDSAVNFVGESYLVSNSSDLTPQSWNVASVAPPAASSYFVRLRVEPPANYGDSTPVSVTFTQINAVPEPAALTLLPLVGALTLRRHRRGA